MRVPERCRISLRSRLTSSCRSCCNRCKSRCFFGPFGLQFLFSHGVQFAALELRLNGLQVLLQLHNLVLAGFELGFQIHLGFLDLGGIEDGFL